MAQPAQDRVLLESPVPNAPYLGHTFPASARLTLQPFVPGPNFSTSASGEMTMPTTAPVATDRHRLRAYEIWGGNGSACDRVSVPGFDLQLFCQPFQGDTGGDLRYVSTCAMGNIVRFTLADIAGHGHEVSDTALRLRAMMRKHMNKPNPTKFARALNYEFTRLSLEGIFATAVICTYFAPTDHLIVCNAGHPRPLFYKASNKEWSLLDENHHANIAQSHATDIGIGNLPLGIIGETNYPQFAIRLMPGDVVIPYTDALIEAANSSGRALGEEGLLRLASRLEPGQPGDLATALKQLVDQYRGTTNADDDVSVMALCHNASDPPRMAFGEWLNVLGRMVGFMK